MTVFPNRETWLEAAITELRPWFEEKKYPLPERVLISCGWPKSQGGRARAIGQAFDPVWTDDGTGHVFISPTLSGELRVLDVTLHELCHLAVGVTAGHAGPFVSLIRAFGLVGKPTHTHAEPTSHLGVRLKGLAELLGPYPHSAMMDRRLAPARPPGGGWLKYWSPSVTDKYILRVSPKSLDEYGPPVDPFGDKMIPATD